MNPLDTVSVKNARWCKVLHSVQVNSNSNCAIHIFWLTSRGNSTVIWLADIKVGNIRSSKPMHFSRLECFTNEFLDYHLSHCKFLHIFHCSWNTTPSIPKFVDSQSNCDILITGFKYERVDWYCKYWKVFILQQVKSPFNFSLPIDLMNNVIFVYYEFHAGNLDITNKWRRYK